MHPDCWSLIEKLYHDALEREPGERTAFLDHNCPDEELRREVQSLLANERKGDQLFEDSPWKPSLCQFATGEEPGPALAAGTRLGPYEIVSPIGAGGMGEVYRARDTRLSRTVAIKILAAHLDSDVARKRFEHEARALSSLNHPHICALYDVGHQNEIDYLVMEYLDGETLTQSLKKGRLPLDQAFALCDRDCRGIRSGAPPWSDPPRSEAGQHHGHARRAREDPGFRAGQTAPPGHPIGHSVSNRKRHGNGHCWLHVAGAGARRGVRPVLRPVQLRRGAL
jgi:hypothetical protein